MVTSLRFPSRTLTKQWASAWSWIIDWLPGAQHRIIWNKNWRVKRNHKYQIQWLLNSWVKQISLNNIIWYSFCSFFYSQTYSTYIQLSCDVINISKKWKRKSTLCTALCNLRRLHRSKKNHRNIIVIGQIIGFGQIDSFIGWRLQSILQYTRSLVD